VDRFRYRFLFEVCDRMVASKSIVAVVLRPLVGFFVFYGVLFATAVALFLTSNAVSDPCVVRDVPELPVPIVLQQRFILP